MKLTRAQLCQKYALAEWTFDAIKGLLSAKKPQAEHGRAYYTLTADDELLLQCAGAHGASFATVKHHLLPFHRFLCYRLMIAPCDEVLADLHRHHLLSPRFDRSSLAFLEAHLISRLPEAIREYVINKTPPRPEHEALFRWALTAIGACIAYDNPEWVDQYLAIATCEQEKINIEAILSTHGSIADKVTVLTEICGFEWEASDLLLYESLFYDIGFMSDADMDFYFKFIPPTERRVKLMAAKISPLMLSIIHGCAVHTEETERVAALAISREIVQINEIRDERFGKLHTLLTTLDKLKRGAAASVTDLEGTAYFANTSIIAGDEAISYEDVSKVRAPETG